MVMGTKSPQGARLNPRFTLEVCEGMNLANAVANAGALGGGDFTILVYPGAIIEGDITPVAGTNLTIRGMGTRTVEIAPVVAPATGVIVLNVAIELVLENLIITAPDATAPAVAVSAGVCFIELCDVSGDALGDAIVMTGGTVSMLNTRIVAGDIDLSTDDCTLTIDDSEINGTLDTAGAVIHTIHVLDSNFGDNAINLLATGVCISHFEGCHHMGAITDASLGAGAVNGHICRCHAGGGLTKNGTTGWLVDNAALAFISSTNATGGITVVGGVVMSYTRAVGSIVWWWDGNTLKVIPSGTITDTIIGWAVAAAGAGDTVIIHPGTYEEAVTLAAGINLVGVDKEQCIINIDHAVLVTMAAACRVANLTLDATCDGTGDGVGIELNDAACTVEDVNIVLHRSAGTYATGILESTGATARTIYIRNVRCRMTDDSNERGIAILQAGKTIYIEESWIQGSDYGLAIGVSAGAAVASTIYSSHNHFEATSASARSVFNNGGTIRMNGDTVGQVDHTGGGFLRENAGVITYKNAPQQYEVWAGMSVQNALTAAAADSPAPAITAPYTALIHPGIYDEVVTCASWVNLMGVGPKGSVVIYQNDATIINGADNVELQNFTIRLGTPAGGQVLFRDNGGAYTMKFDSLVIEIATPGAGGHNLFYFTGAGTYTFENCSHRVAGTGTSYTIQNVTASADFRLYDNNFEWDNASAWHIRTTMAGTWTGGGNRWAGNCSMFRVAGAATITLDKDAVVCAGGSEITAGAVALRTGYHSYEVFPGMWIQHAVGAGRYIFVHPGTFTLTASLAITVSNLTIQGAGRQTIITTATNNVDIITCTGGAGTELENIILRDFLVRGFLTGVRNDVGIIWTYVDNSKIINVWVEENGEEGIVFINCDNIELESAHSMNNYIHGIHFAPATWAKATNCVCSNNRGHGIVVGGADISLVNPTCSGNDNANTNTYDGINVTNANRVTIIGAQCDANDRHGLMIHESSYCSVTGGQFNNNTQGDGIHIAGDAPNADYNTLTGGVATGNGSDGIEISEVGAGDANKNIVLGWQLLGNGGVPLNDGGTLTDASHNIVA